MMGSIISMRRVERGCGGGNGLESLQVNKRWHVLMTINNTPFSGLYAHIIRERYKIDLSVRLQ